MNSSKKLREGFTTGACAATVAKAAWQIFNGEKITNKISTLFPDRKKRVIKIKSAEKHGDNAVASVIKDAGDDPDVTDKACIRATIRSIEKENISEHDYILEILNASFVVRGGKGIGLVTRKGLVPPENKWAINPVPLKMIAENIAACKIMRRGLFLIEIEVQDGEKIALKTLNPALGIKGGISILGTSGIVVPYSNKAYLDTIKILIEGAKANNVDHIVFSTGATTAKAAKKIFPEISELAIIRIGDFIKPSLCFAAPLKFHKVSVACMPGKLLKYAVGHENTHAKNATQQLSELAKFAKDIHLSDNEIEKIKNAVTVKEVFYFFDSETATRLLEKMAEAALNKFSLWICQCLHVGKSVHEYVAATPRIELDIFDFGGRLILRKENSVEAEK